MPKGQHLRALNSQTLVKAETRLTRSDVALAESARRIARPKEALEKSRVAMRRLEQGDAPADTLG